MRFAYALYLRQSSVPTARQRSLDQKKISEDHIYRYTDYSCNFMILHAQVFRGESNP